MCVTASELKILFKIFIHFPIKVSTEHVRQWCQLNNNIPYFEIAARDSRRVEDAFKLAAKLAVKYFDEQGSDVTDVCIVLDEDCRSPKNWGYSS